jgi:hypothetical protein
VRPEIERPLELNRFKNICKHVHRRANPRLTAFAVRSMPLIARRLVAVLPDVLQIVPLSRSYVATIVAAMYVGATGSLSQAQCAKAASRIDSQEERS